jgi:hypothetical protein
MLPPLDAPHHLRKHEWGPYREGRPLYLLEFLISVVDEKCKENLCKNGLVSILMCVGFWSIGYNLYHLCFCQWLAQNFILRTTYFIYLVLHVWSCCHPLLYRHLDLINDVLEKSWIYLYFSFACWRVIKCYGKVLNLKYMI